MIETKICKGRIFLTVNDILMRNGWSEELLDSLQPSHTCPDPVHEGGTVRLYRLKDVEEVEQSSDFRKAVHAKEYADMCAWVEALIIEPRADFNTESLIPDAIKFYNSKPYLIENVDENTFLPEIVKQFLICHYTETLKTQLWEKWGEISYLVFPLLDEKITKAIHEAFPWIAVS